jgi:CDK inhibitor PHO81
VGVCIELKYPTLTEQSSLKFTSAFDLNAFVNNVLRVVYDNLPGRRIIFSSLNPQVCTTINWKQPNYGVFFKTRCGYGAASDNENVSGGLKEKDKRCNSIKEAIRFAKTSNFLGLICESTPLVREDNFWRKKASSNGFLIADQDARAYKYH